MEVRVYFRTHPDPLHKEREKFHMSTTISGGLLQLPFDNVPVRQYLNSLFGGLR